MASPLTKPSITEWGIILTNLPSLNSPAAVCKMPAKMRVANRYCNPMLLSPPRALPSLIKCTITTAKAPVAPEIMPGLPPKIEVINPIMKAPYKPMIGEIPATKANATASGTKARATVKPESTSSFILPFVRSIRLNCFKNVKIVY